MKVKLQQFYKVSLRKQLHTDTEEVLVYIRHIYVEEIPLPNFKRPIHNGKYNRGNSTLQI
jgi:hypothetical protein